MKCAFCKRRSTKRHFCRKMFCYKNIFYPFFINIMLQYKPLDFLDFYCKSMKYINVNKLFQESSNPSDIVRSNLIIFVNENDCY